MQICSLICKDHWVSSICLSLCVRSTFKKMQILKSKRALERCVCVCYSYIWILLNTIEYDWIAISLIASFNMMAGKTVYCVYFRNQKLPLSISDWLCVRSLYLCSFNLFTTKMSTPFNKSMWIAIAFPRNRIS